MPKKRKRIDPLDEFLKTSNSFDPEGLFALLKEDAEGNLVQSSLIFTLSKLVDFKETGYFLSLISIIPYESLFKFFDRNIYKKPLTKIYDAVNNLVQEGIVSVVPTSKIEIPSDGNCMYASVLEALRQRGNDSEYTTDSLRAEVVRRINENFQIYRPLLESQLIDLVESMRFEEMVYGHNPNFISLANELISIAPGELQQYIQSHDVISRYLEIMSEDGVWGGDVELGIIAEILSIQIEVHNVEEQSFFHINYNPMLESVSVALSGNHYNIIEGYEIVINDFDSYSEEDEVKSDATGDTLIVEDSQEMGPVGEAPINPEV